MSVRLPADCELIETMRLLPDGTIPLWPSHRARLVASAAALGFVIDEAAIDAAYHRLSTCDIAAPQRCRLTLGQSGSVSTAMVPLGEIRQPVMIRFYDRSVVRPAGTRFLDAYKVSIRDHYERAFEHRDGADDVLLCNEQGEITECTIFNVYVENDEGVFTPPLRCGLLPGIGRARLIESGWAVERVLTYGDVASASQLYVSNAVRGCLKARLV